MPLTFSFLSLFFRLVLLRSAAAAFPLLLFVFTSERKEKKDRGEIMARGKIRIKRIENETNRQVTYSKRRNVLFKKTHKLTVLYDAKVSLIMFSGNSELREYISPSATTKQLFDHYQKTLGIDLWSSHYERMQEDLKKLKEVNKSLRREIRQRRGESLSDLNLEELYGLEQNMESAVKVIRDCKKKMTEECILGPLL